jgi:metal-dependent amidase/aminoacylase/carboxypeptidase family protein
MLIDREKPARNIFLIFQHAEEVAGGGEEASSVLDTENIAEIYGLHNAPGQALGAVACMDGVINSAVAAMVIHLEGVYSHASMPELGRNPAAAMAEIILGVPAIVSAEKRTDPLLSTMVYCGIGSLDALGVNPGSGVLILKNRAVHEDELRGLESHIESFVKDTCAKHTIEAKISYEETFPETKNHRAQFEKVRQATEKLGLPFIERSEAVLGGEDFGYYLKKKPGAFFHLGIGEGLSNIHTPGYNYNDEAIPYAVALFWELATL